MGMGIKSGISKRKNKSKKQTKGRKNILCMIISKARSNVKAKKLDNITKAIK